MLAASAHELAGGGFSTPMGLHALTNTGIVFGEGGRRRQLCSICVIPESM